MQKKVVIYIEKEKFLRDLMEKAVNGAGFEFFSYPDHDCLHFIEDLKPAILVVDRQTVDDDFFNSIDSQIPLILTGQPDTLKLDLGSIVATLEKPLGPFDLVANITKALQN